MPLRLPLKSFVMMLMMCSAVWAQNEGFISTRGREIITSDGTPVLLRGINLGNWLVPEGYMFKFDSATSPRMINDVLCQLVGADEARAFWNRYRNAYITRDDIQFIKKLGLNSVRVPFNWRLFTVEDYPGCGRDPVLKCLTVSSGGAKK